MAGSYSLRRPRCASPHAHPGARLGHEDTAPPLNQIEAAFGPRVAAGVSALTKDAALDKPAAMKDSLTRILRRRRSPSSSSATGSPTSRPRRPTGPPPRSLL